jgi:hypothetical protein
MVRFNPLLEVRERRGVGWEGGKGTFVMIDVQNPA